MVGERSSAEPKQCWQWAMERKPRATKGDRLAKEFGLHPDYKRKPLQDLKLRSNRSDLLCGRMLPSAV